jgi:hypothetical protein
MQIQPTFHNVAEAEALPNLPGLFLQRFPRQVRECLNNSARQSGQDDAGVEIRFKTKAPQVRVTLTAHLGEEGEAVFYKGPYEHLNYKLPHGVETTITLPYVEKLFEGQPQENLHAGGFSTDVWRLCLHRCAFRYHGIETFGHPLLPVEPGDTPRVRWLAYGSSITHANLSGYVFMAAMLLGVDVANKGLGGGCHAEPEMAEFLATQECDFRPTLPIVIISPFRNGNETSPLPDPRMGENLRAYRAILSKIHAEANDPRLSLIDGNDILNRFDLLRFDLVHPSSHGHALMGVNLARALQPLVDGLKAAAPTS